MTVRAEDPLFDVPGEMAALMAAHDWAATPLGPSPAWPQSLRTLVRVMLTSRYAMWLGWGPELVFFYNDAYRPTLGIKHPRALGRPAQVVWAEIWGTIGPRIASVLETGVATWDEGLLLFLERSGFPEETYHTFSYSPAPADDGSTGGLLCVVTEETERVIGERRLAVLRDLAAQLAATETSAAVVAAVERALGSADRDLPFALVFAADGRLLVSSGGGDPAPGTWPLDDGAGRSEPVVFALPAGVAWPRGPWILAPVQAVALPLGPHGTLVAGLNAHRPVDAAYLDFLGLFAGQVGAALARAHAYEEERRRAEALAALDRAKTAFFSNVSHELRTPLTLMLGPLVELGAQAGLDADGRRDLALVHRNGVRLLKLVNTLLDFSRIEAGRVQATYVPTDLAVATADLASVFRAAIEKAGVRLIVDTPALDVPVFVDRGMWEKIVLNLLSNAFKFTFAGTIEVILRRDGDEVVLLVRDTGIGVPAAELPRLFERFHRVEGARGRTYEGTGIGLALVHELVKLHGGTIGATSVEGQGTTFELRLPVGHAHLPAGQVVITAPAAGDGPGAAAGAFVEEALRWLPDEHTGPIATTGSSPSIPVPGETAERIVLADDNADMRDYLRRLLGTRWRVEAVRTGREALHAIDRELPALVLTDVMMPDLDGFGLVAALRAQPATRALPVLMLSARAGEEARAEGLEAGADDYLVKPFAARELLARVDALVARARVAAVEEAEARRMAAVLAQAPVAIAILRGPDLIFEVANRAFRATLGGRDVIGQPLRTALPEADAVDVVERVYRTGEPVVARAVRLVLARGPGGADEEAFFDAVYQPIVSDGETTGLAIVGFEVTELVAARRTAEAASRAKDEFLAMLGHELRNPLAPIQTALELLQMRFGDLAVREREVIERQVRHLVALVDDLLDMSRITQGKVQLRVEPIELAAVIARAVEMASPLLERHRHALTLDVPRTGVVVTGDPARLAQVVANLLTNAAKYTPPGGRVTVRGARDGDRVVLRVIDTGIGIEPEMLARIFEPFAQERQAIDRAQGGLGLGLAIVRSLVELHGGTVAAQSAGHGQGSQITVTLPATAAPLPAAAAAATPAATPAIPGAAIRILIVDDNTDAAELLGELLESWGYATRTAPDGPSALQVAAAFQPDLAILDLGLPVMDGFELARRIAEDPALGATRLVALTGYGQDVDRARSKDAGFAAHLVKPVDTQLLRATLTALAPR